ncbi:MAG: STAS domain-containing protein, partial [Actinomycetota bacterium]|nr:STAS domain-containing protein [Actinomycetota bacterium]
TASPDAGSGEAGDPTRIELPGQADIRVAADIHALCLTALEASGEVRIDCAQVERIDAAVLQCLGALAHGLRQGERDLELSGRTDSFDRAVEVLGFRAVLEGS